MRNTLFVAQKISEIDEVNYEDPVIHISQSHCIWTCRFLSINFRTNQMLSIVVHSRLKPLNIYRSSKSLEYSSLKTAQATIELLPIKCTIKAVFANVGRMRYREAF